jgi:hypothetical protein
MRAVTLLAGHATAGKSTIATEIAAAVSAGRSLPGGPKPSSPANVVYLAAEENPSAVIKPRLIAAGADEARVFFPGWKYDGLYDRRLRLPSGRSELEDIVSYYHARLLVVDPIGSFVDPEMNENDGRCVRDVMQALADIAQRQRCAVLVIKHLRKGTGGGPLHRVAGSVEWTNVPRSVLFVGRDPHDKDRRVITVCKSSLGIEVPSQIFSLFDAEGAVRINWLGDSQLTADDVDEDQGDPAARGALVDAKCFLKDQLNSSDKKVKDLERLADESGIRSHTLRRAKESLGVTSHPKGSNEDRSWYWRKPEKWPE